MLLDVLTWTALAMSVVAFVVFIILSFRSRARAGTGGTGGAGLVAQGAVSDLAELTKALADLTNSFQKAGPALSALVASILFFLIATLGAGLDKLAK